MNDIQLHVGYIGITREGKRVEITESRKSGWYPWRSSNGNTYDSKGYLWRRDMPANNDIIGPWVETLVEPQVNYNDGNWHRWDGATECPVHNKSVVEYVWHDEIGTSGVLNRVSGWDGSDVKVAWERVIKFRVTKEYVAPPVEPREFWIMYSKIMQPRIESHKPLDTTGYIHVKEVTNA
jgi:hypothetical protein